MKRLRLLVPIATFVLVLFTVGCPFGLSKTEQAYNDGNDFTEQVGAIPHFTIAIQLDLDLAEAYNNHGVSYNKLSQTTNAAADFAKACELGYRAHC